MIKYTYWHIKNIFNNDYGLTLESTHEYKGGRYAPLRYNLINNSTGSIEVPNVTLDALRIFLESAGYSLKDE